MSDNSQKQKWWQKAGYTPNARFNCLECGSLVEKYVLPSMAGTKKDRLLFCSCKCAGKYNARHRKRRQFGRGGIEDGAVREPESATA